MFINMFKKLSPILSPFIFNFRYVELELMMRHSLLTISKLYCSSGVSRGTTIRDILKFWNNEFKNNHISEPKQSVNLILAHVLKVNKLSDVAKISKHKMLNKSEVAEMNRLCRQRLTRMPVQYIIREWDFRDLNVEIAPPVLIPRPETEQLVDIVSMEILNKKCNKILEIGCGSGVISLSLLKKFPRLNITAIDKSKEACELTKRNAIRNKILGKLKIVQCRIAADNFRHLFEEKFDIIVSNPPYIPTKRLTELQPEITLFEDPEALDGGPDGLSIIKLILQMAPLILNEKGKIFLEVDYLHSEIISSLLQANDLNLSFLKCHKDLFGKNRFVEIIYEETK